MGEKEWALDLESFGSPLHVSRFGELENAGDLKTNMKNWGEHKLMASLKCNLRMEGQDMHF